MKALVIAAALACVAMTPQAAMALHASDNPNFGYRASGKGTGNITKYEKKHRAGLGARNGHRPDDVKTAECRHRAHAAGLKGRDAVHPFVVRCKRGGS